MKSYLAIACLIGTTLEWYDFSIFGFFSPVFAQLFFPNQNTAVSLLKTLIVFAAGFLARPIGGVVWGYLGDKIGRKKIIVMVMFLMTLSSVLIGLLPTYNQIGILAPLLLVILRLLQGFSASGEHAGMLTYLYEKSLSNKGIYSSLSIVGVYFGMSLAVLMAFITNSLLNKTSFLIWGWRIPFLLSLALGCVGYFIRTKLLESAIFEQQLLARKSFSLKIWLFLIKEKVGLLLAGIGLFQLAVVIPYVIFVYMVTYQIKEATISVSQVYFITCCNLLITGVSIVYFANYFDKKRNNQLFFISIAGIAAGSIFLFPLYFNHSLIESFVTQLYFAVFTAMLVGPLCLLFASWFPVAIRFSSISICFNFSATFFGGFSPVIMAFLQLTPIPITYSVVFLVCSSAIALFSMIFAIQNKNATVTESYQLLEKRE